MTTEEFKSLLKTTYEALVELTNTKGVEYANSTDQLANFKRQSERLGMRPEQVVMVYLSKHLDAITYHAKTGQSLSENVDGRLMDSILYLILYRGIVMERKIGRIT